MPLAHYHLKLLCKTQSQLLTLDCYLCLWVLTKEGVAAPWNYCGVIGKGGIWGLRGAFRLLLQYLTQPLPGSIWGPSAHPLLSSEAASSNAALQHQNRWHTLLAVIQRCHQGLRKLSVKERERDLLQKWWSERTEVQTEFAQNRCLATAVQTHAQTKTLWQMGVWVELDTT